MSQPPPFFVADGDRFVPSASARGPWSTQHQHGGPPAALLARAFARHASPDAQIARLTFDFLRPVPLAPLSVATRVVRAGAKAQRLAGTVLAEDGAAVIEATCLVIRVAPNRVAVPLETRVCPPPPAEGEPFELPFMSGDEGYHRAVEWRIARGTWGRGPVAAWLRLRVPLVAGETPTPPLECLVAVADSASGLAVVVDPARATFVNGDLTLALHRIPTGEWMCLDAATTGARHGIGLTRARLWDTTGLVGRSLQTLLLEPRADTRE
ncbi:MAG TPA: thioesterase family protein [Methylomirabilota bacterium]|nr:thioesterase family protein [Methylomirabilota bacterium]